MYFATRLGEARHQHLDGKWRAGPPPAARQQERTADVQLKRETVTDDELRAVFTQADGR